jgi:hypothetical protein
MEERKFEQSRERTLRKLARGIPVLTRTIKKYNITDSDIKSKQETLPRWPQAKIDKYILDHNSKKKDLTDPKMFEQRRANYLKQFELNPTSVPKMGSLEKYKITIADLNVIRKANGLKPLTEQSLIKPVLIPDSVGTAAYQTKLKNEADSLKSDIKKANTIVLNRLNNETKASKVVQKDRAELDESLNQLNDTKKLANEQFDTFNLSDLKTFYDSLVADNKMSITTSNNYIQALNTLLKKIGYNADRDLIDILNTDYDELEAEILMYKNPNTRKTLAQALLKMIDTVPDLKRRVLNRDQYYKLFNDFKIDASARNISKVDDSNDLTYTFDDILKAIKAKYGVKSKEYLLFLMYSEFTARDDYGDLWLVKTDQNLKEDQNYIFLNKMKAELILNVFKTDKKYGQIRFTFSKEIYDLIKKLKIKYDTLIFGKSETEPFNQTNSLSSYVIKILKSVGFMGSINVLRRIKVSSILNKKNVSESERVKLAKSMMHSPDSSLKYVRKFKE